jgi:hypothetical protein
MAPRKNEIVKESYYTLILFWLIIREIKKNSYQYQKAFELLYLT